MLASLRQQFLSFWKKLSLPRQITLVTLLAAAFFLTPVLVTWATQPTYEVAYSGLSEADAAQIVQKLDDSNIAYRLQDTGTIEVPSDQVYSVRLMMAREGLPQSSTVGYELFSGTSTLGMTEFTQQVNYQRAVEGELQRTIGSLDAVKAVRVHLVTPEKSLLTVDQATSTASVTLQIKPGKALDAAQVKAITHLVASSVEGLKPENVVIVDSNGNLLAAGMGADLETILSPKDDQRAAELAYADEVKKRVQAILDKTLGPNRAAVQASVEMDWTQREVTSNTYEPTQIAVRSSQVINESSTNGGATGGVPGASSNLATPVPTVTAAAGSSYQRNEETINYEVSQVQAHEIAAPGKISRLSVSVMVDSVTDQAQLDIIKAAVTAAAGIDTQRGDQIVVESFNFDRTALDAMAAELAQQQQQELYIRIGTAVAAAVIVLMLLLIALRMINNVRNASKQSWLTVMRPVSELAALQGAPAGAAALPGASAQTPAFPAPAEAATPAPSSTPAQQPKPESEDVVVQLSSRPQSASTSEDEQRSRIIARLAEENPATVAEIIQIWLNQGNKS